MFSFGTSQQKPTSHQFHSHSKVIFLLENLSFQKSSQEILNAINLSVYQGDFLFITGDSGSGKTSLLNILSGQSKPSSGHFESSFAGHCVYTQENDSFFDKLTCYDNLAVAYDPKIYTSRGEFQKIAYDLSDLLGVQSQLQIKMEVANKGLKQKISFIRSILSKPSVLLIDELSSSLDWQSTQKIVEILSYYNKQAKMTVVWATSNEQLPKIIGAKSVCLKKGRMLRKGIV